MVHKIHYKRTTNGFFMIHVKIATFLSLVLSLAISICYVNHSHRHFYLYPFYNRLFPNFQEIFDFD